jgi:hypothetical protein
VEGAAEACAAAEGSLPPAEERVRPPGQRLDQPPGPALAAARPRDPRQVARAAHPAALGPAVLGPPRRAISPAPDSAQRVAPEQPIALPQAARLPVN